MATESDSCRAMIKDEADDGVRTRTYRRRWAMLAIFDGIALVNGLEWITFAPINSLAQTYYGVSASDINFLSTIFMILFLPGLVGSSLLTHRYGSRTMCITSSALSFGCALLRWVSTGSGQAGRPFGYTYALIGQVLGALAQPALLAMPARLASEWFPASQRNTATVVLSMANPIGIAVGQVLPSMIVPGPGTDGFPLLSLIVLVCASVSFVSSWFLWSKPPLPPSAAAAHRSAIHVHTDAPSIIVGHLRTMFSTKGFVALTVGFGIGLAVFNVILTVIEALIEPAGFKSDDAGIFGGIAILAGLVGSGIAGGVLDATQKYRALLRVFAVSSLVVVTATLTVLGLHPPYALACVMFALLGASMLPMLPLTLESAAECTYPVPEELSSGVQMLAGNVLGFVGVIVVQYLLGGRPVFLVYSAGECLIVAVMIVAASAMFVFDGPYLRQ